MKLYVSQSSAAAGCVAVDDMILTTDQPTAAGSKMLDGYMSLFGAEVVEKIKAAGYEVGGKVNVGEFSIDMLGETPSTASAQTKAASWQAQLQRSLRLTVSKPASHLM